MDIPAQISARANVYLSLVDSVQDRNGFIDYKYCDSLLFSSLIGVHDDIKVDLSAAEKGPGEWYRRPLIHGDCYETGESSSRISRDMILGVMFYAWVKRDAQMLQNLWDYGSKNNWIMGKVKEADNSLASLMSTNYLTLLAKMLHYMTGKDYAVRHTPIIVDNDCKGFECHLLVLFLLLLGSVDGGLTDNHVNLLTKISKQNPYNPLYWVAANVYGANLPTKIIWRHYPVNRLPNTNDRCEGWATQRDDDDVKALSAGCWDNRPFHIHSGGDLIFVDWVAREYKGTIRQN